ncbi:MAG: zinc ribbon domain-containing protein [Gemmatimonadota bacterium]
MKCPGCGRNEEGKFCSACGTALTPVEAACSSCGTKLRAGALYCGQCGAPSGPRSGKPFAAKLPWIFSGLALVAFAIGISLFIQGQTSARAPGMPPTGGVIESPGSGGAASGGAASGGAGMPSMAELAAMGPRQAADRLFDRVMQSQADGDLDQARRFGPMAKDAYSRVPPAEVDMDMRFHMGMLDLTLGDPAGAVAVAESMLAQDAGHLLALVLGLRAAEAAGDPTASNEYLERLRSAHAESGGTGRPEYDAHRAVIDEALQGQP